MLILSDFKLYTMMNNSAWFFIINQKQSHVICQVIFYVVVGAMKFQCEAANLKLNIECRKDSSKNGPYNVFCDWETWMPNKLEHFLSCPAVVIRRPCASQYVYCYSFGEKIQTSGSQTCN